MLISFIVDVEVSRISGKFISKDELAAEIEAALDDADLGTFTVGDSEYETTTWLVTRPGR